MPDLVMLPDPERRDGATLSAAEMRAGLSASVAEEIELREQARVIELDPTRAAEARALFQAASRLAERRFEVIRWLLGLTR